MTNSIRKGKSAEREVVLLCKNFGIPAKRISMMETAHEDKGDVEIAGTWTAQVKCGSHVPTTVYKFMENQEEFLFMKRDRKKWLVVMDAKWFLKEFLS